MNVLVTGSTFPRWKGDHVPDFIWKQILSIQKSSPDIRITILVPHDQDAMREETWEGITIRRFRYFWPTGLQKLAYPAIWPNIRQNVVLALQVPFLLIAEFFAAALLIVRKDIDLVYSHWFMPQGVACGFAALLTRTPHVFTSHSSDVEILGRIPLLGTWLVRFLVRKCRAVTVVSRRSHAKLKAFFSESMWGDIEKKVKIIPMGIDLKDRSPDRELGENLRCKLGIEHKNIILFIGRLAEKKGIQYILESVASQQLRSHDLALIIAGDGPLLKPLQQKVQEMNLQDDVHFLGYVSGPDKKACFAAADLLVLPSIITAGGDAEGFPVILMEGLAEGKICIATDVSGADEVLATGENGFLVPQKDAVALQQAITSALTLSPEQTQEIQERARQSAKRFDWSHIASEHYQHLLA